jgi:hypothetical protein
MKRFMVKRTDDADVLRAHLRTLDASIGVSLDTGSGSWKLTVLDATDEAMTAVNAQLEAAGSKTIAEIVPDTFAMADRVHEARDAAALMAKAPTKYH